MSEEKKAYGQLIDITNDMWQATLYKWATESKDWFAFGRSEEDIAADRQRHALDRMIRGIGDAAFAAIERWPAARTPMVTSWLLQQTKEWRDHECDY
jgi:hypothetical protein